MRAREAIEADLEILTWPHVVLDAAVVYDRLLRDVAPLLAALGEATRRAEALTETLHEVVCDRDEARGSLEHLREQLHGTALAAVSEGSSE